GGVTFSGPDELIDLLIGDERFAECIVEQITTYALGRGVESTDAPYLAAITEAFVQGDHRFDHLASLVATSGIFTQRGAEPEAVEEGE
ncbi:MAG: DUF1585 domain-containing protein, partial [Myxococcota bacterium]|nr:DUF1585 domain-containing protein [Myxococcota bacterium]